MKLKDSLSQSLKPVQSNKEILIYSCGPTVYDYPHIGNWYAFLRWDLLVRSLQVQDIKIKWVMNITDVGHLVSDADEGEDKLAKRAHQEKKTAYELADYYTDYFLKALDRLNFNKPDYLPKATDYINEQINLVKILEAKGFTYLIDDGLYYDTAKLADYGKLAQKDRSGFKGGARIEANDQKRQATDFALWKLTPQGQIRDMEWDSPWGRGFPGWHLECSAMCYALLSKTIDIHAGGIDHIPIHHTNELAQSEVAYGQPMTNIWLHSNFVTVDGQKMSKSLNNFYTLEDIENKGYSLSVFRLAVFRSRYFNLVDFNWNLMEQAEQQLLKWYNLAVRRWQLSLTDEKDQDIKNLFNQNLDQIIKALNDNLNSPLALEYVDQIYNNLCNQVLSEKILDHLDSFLGLIDQIFGLHLSKVEDVSLEIKQILNDRHQARQAKDYQTSDKLREKLLAYNINVLDTDFGQIWQINDLKKYKINE